MARQKKVAILRDMEYEKKELGVIAEKIEAALEIERRW